jgi:tetraacyldisaccharide 4'-kinase
MKLFKPKFWDKKKSIIAFFLLPLSVIFQILVLIKNIFIRKNNFSIPIICVGNIYLGGTGKTPLCIELSKILKKLNKKNAIIKKYYKAHEDESRLVESNEIRLFESSSRALAIKKAEIEKFDCVILDDGFQDSSIIKDLNIICFNEEQLNGNGLTLPSGPLREPLNSLRRSQIVVINGKTNEAFEKRIKSISDSISVYYSQYLPTNIDQFKSQNLLAFAGIGNPNNFFNLLKKYNLRIIKELSFPDHYDYSLRELNDLVAFSKNNNLQIITTEKDYFRLKKYKIPQIQYLNVKLAIKNEKKFEDEVMKCL